VNHTAPFGYSPSVSSLFRRKSADVATSDSADPADSVAEVEPAVSRPKSYTPSKKELGLVTPKRASTSRKVNGAAPENRREAMRQSRENRRRDSQERTEGMRNGDERYMLVRDRGPERQLVRNVVDARRTIGTWFFGGALIVLIGTTVRITAVQFASNILWAILAVGVVIDSILIAQKVKKLTRERFPKTEQRIGSLQIYGIMRALTFRRMRTPKPQVKLGDKP
jgi:hypothetical protein